VVTSNELGEGIVQIMKQCWQEVPEIRMTFRFVILQINLFCLKSSNSVSILANMCHLSLSQFVTSAESFSLFFGFIIECSDRQF